MKPKRVRTACRESSLLAWGLHLLSKKKRKKSPPPKPKRRGR